jgi:hypothetical protein
VNPEDILADCLNDLKQGLTPAECAAKYPGLPGLETQLRLAVTLRHGQKFDLRPEARRRIETQIRQNVRGALPSRSAQPLSLGLRWLAPVLAAALVVSGFGVTAASAASLPGDPLYGVKRTTETVQLEFTPLGGQAALHTRFAGRRLDELQALAARGVFDAKLLDDLNAESEAALTTAEAAPAQQQADVLAGIVSLTDRAQTVLERVKASAPPQAQAGLQRALEAVQKHHDRAKSHGRPGNAAGAGTPCPTNPGGHPMCKP